MSKRNRHRRNRNAVQKATPSQILAPGDRSFLPPPHYPAGWWQQGYPLWPNGRDGSATVESCVALYAEIISQMPAKHWRSREDGGRDEVRGSVASRMLRRPNAYQTRVDFMSSVVRELLDEGNGYAVAERDERDRIVQMHPLRKLVPLIEPQTRSIFYQPTVANELMPTPPVLGQFWPARDVMHVRIHTPTNPLVGVTPLQTAMMAVEAGSVIQAGFASFMRNVTRPGGYLAIPETVKMSTDVTEQLRQDWTANATGGNQGRIGVLRHGIKWEPMKLDAIDPGMVEAYRMTVADIARAFRVPLQLLGETGGTTFSSTETMIRHFLSTGLAPMLERIELCLDALFGLPEGEYIELETEYLLRADFITRMDGLSKAVLGGIMAPNEARRMEGLPRAEHGDEPRLQAQVVPLSAAELAPPAPSAPAPQPGGGNGEDPPADGEDSPQEDPPEDEAAKGVTADPDIVRALVRDMMRTKEMAGA